MKISDHFIFKIDLYTYRYLKILHLKKVATGGCQKAANTFQNSMEMSI